MCPDLSAAVAGLLAFSNAELSIWLLNPKNQHKIEFRRHTLRGETWITIRVYGQPLEESLFETGPPVDLETGHIYYEHFLADGFEKVQTLLIPTS